MTIQEGVKRAKKLWGKKAHVYFQEEGDRNYQTNGFTVGSFNTSGPCLTWGWKIRGEGKTLEAAFENAKRVVK